MTAGLLVAGTTSDAGKSLVTTGLCRWLARRGVRVAPFKAQNMSNNSMVCPDGDEIGRAQWLQAIAARAVPEAAMNPVLLKPGDDRCSHVVVMGHPAGTLRSGEWATGRTDLAEAAFSAFRDLSDRYDVVIAEGAGSPAEINLRSGDFVNLGLARRFGLPVVVVGDIDRGGVLAAMYGTLGLLEPQDQALVRAWVVNKFRGSLDLLRPGLTMLEERTARPVLGVLPFLADVWCDSEDGLCPPGSNASHSLTLGNPPPTTLVVAVVRLPRASNTTDIDALIAEPGVDVRITADPDIIARADVVIVPGTRSTLSDLQWLRSQHIDRVLITRTARGMPVLGICGGYQMLARRLDDRHGVESATLRSADGLGLLPTVVHFQPHKQLGTPRTTWRDLPVQAYEIHHGLVTVDTERAAGPDLVPFLDGWRSDCVWGTTWHGILDNDRFRRALLAELAAQAGVPWRADASQPGYRQRRDDMIDRLADAIEEHLDTTALASMIGLTS